jgi:hypothetical protein
MKENMSSSHNDRWVKDLECTAEKQRCESERYSSRDPVTLAIFQKTSASSMDLRSTAKGKIITDGCNGPEYDEAGRKVSVLAPIARAVAPAEENDNSPGTAAGGAVVPPDKFSGFWQIDSVGEVISHSTSAPAMKLRSSPESKILIDSGNSRNLSERVHCVRPDRKVSTAGSAPWNLDDEQDICVSHRPSLSPGKDGIAEARYFTASGIPYARSALQMTSFESPSKVEFTIGPSSESSESSASGSAETSAARELETSKITDVSESGVSQNEYLLSELRTLEEPDQLGSANVWGVKLCDRARWAKVRARCPVIHRVQSSATCSLETKASTSLLRNTIQRVGSWC